jgi:hypothetical protein
MRLPAFSALQEASPSSSVGSHTPLDMLSVLRDSLADVFPAACINTYPTKTYHCISLTSSWNHKSSFPPAMTSFSLCISMIFGVTPPKAA